MAAKQRSLRKLGPIKAKKGLTRANPRSGSAPPVKAVTPRSNTLNAQYHGMGTLDTTKMNDMHGPFSKGRGRIGKAGKAPAKMKAGKKPVKKKD